MEKNNSNTTVRVQCKKLYSIEVAPDCLEPYIRENNPHADELIENTKELLIEEFYKNADTFKKQMSVKCYYNYRGVFTLVELKPYIVQLDE